LPSAEWFFSPTRAARGAEAQKRLRLEGEAVFYMMRCTDRFFYSAKPRFIAARIPKRASRQGGVSDSDTGDKGECTASRQGPFRGPAFR